MTTQVKPFTVEVSDEALADLRDRLERTRWPMDVGNEDWRYGTPRSYLEDLVSYWLDGYDWRAVEREINQHDHYRTELEGIPIHFIHRRGAGADPVPVVLSHGWPWTFWDFAPLIDPLSIPDTDGYGAFDVVVPSLPGFGFSSPLTRTGVGAAKTAQLWQTLMVDVLGYESFGAVGNDFGAIVTQHLARISPEVLIGVYLSRYRRPSGTNQVNTGAVTADDYGPDEQRAWARHQRGLTLGASHLAVNTHDPQSIAYGLNDSPVGLAAWLLERRRNWSGCNGAVESVFSRDDLITSVMIYWLTQTAGSAARFYWESSRENVLPTPETGRIIEVPLGVGVLPDDVIAMPRRHAEEDTNLVRWTELSRGGHFGPAEVPDLYVDELRAFFRPLHRAGGRTP